MSIDVICSDVILYKIIGNYNATYFILTDTICITKSMIIKITLANLYPLCLKLLLQQYLEGCEVK